MARSKPVFVTAHFAAQPGFTNTLEGPVSHDTDDAIVTGVAGEVWPVSRERFLSRYEAVPPTSCGQDGRYRKRPQDVLALRLTEPHSLTLAGQRGTLHGRVGDYLVQYAPGDQAIVEASIFELTYRRVDESA